MPFIGNRAAKIKKLVDKVFFLNNIFVICLLFRNFTPDILKYKYKRNPKSYNRVGTNSNIYIMKEVNFHVVEACVEEKDIFSYVDFCQNGPCDMCWGDLSL